MLSMEQIEKKTFTNGDEPDYLTEFTKQIMKVQDDSQIPSTFHKTPDITIVVEYCMHCRQH